MLLEEGGAFVAVPLTVGVEDESWQERSVDVGAQVVGVEVDAGDDGVCDTVLE